MLEHLHNIIRQIRSLDALLMVVKLAPVGTAAGASVAAANGWRVLAAIECARHNC